MPQYLTYVECKKQNKEEDSTLFFFFNTLKYREHTVFTRGEIGGGWVKQNKGIKSTFTLMGTEKCIFEFKEKTF